MKKINNKNFIENFKFGKGIIRSKSDAQNYIKFGYNPSRLLLHYKIVDIQATQYIISEIAKKEIILN